MLVVEINMCPGNRRVNGLQSNGTFKFFIENEVLWYVCHELRPAASNGNVKKSKRPSWCKCKMFRGLGKEKLSRGHLAPFGDFEHPEDRKRTMKQCENIVPCYATVNAGNIERVELSIRNYVDRDIQRPLRIFSGHFGVLRYFEDVRVPQYLYKILVDIDKNSIKYIVVTSNNVDYENELQIQELPDIFDSVNNGDTSWGLTTCMSLDDFVRFKEKIDPCAPNPLIVRP